MKFKILFVVSCLLFNLPSITFAVDVAPRITDREIIEKLVSLEAGQAALGKRMEVGQAALSKRMDDMNQSLNQRISSLQTTMLALFSAMVALILALFAYIAWDRQTMMKPVVERVEHLENEVLRELDMSHNKGSAITRLIKAMRELAKQDEKVARVLRNYSLL